MRCSNEAEQFDTEVGLCKQPVVLGEHRLARLRVNRCSTTEKLEERD